MHTYIHTWNSTDKKVIDTQLQCSLKSTALVYKITKTATNMYVSSLLGMTGNILNAILDAGFQITAVQMFYLERANAEEFLEVYKGVVAEYTSMVNEMVSGPCIAIAIRAVDAPKAFRDFSGPADPVSIKE